MGGERKPELLDLPVEKLPKMLDFPEMEREVLAFWETNEVFQKLVEKNSTSEKKFSFIDGPITANNPMGIIFSSNTRDSTKEFN